MRYLVFLLMLCSLGGCESFDIVGGSSDFVRHVKLVAADDANNNAPVAVDLVYTSDMALANRLSQMTAKTFFDQKKQLLRDYPNRLMIVHWEIVPGQTVDEMVRENRDGSVTTFVFADYHVPGVHRMALPDSDMLVLYFARHEFHAEPLDK